MWGILGCRWCRGCEGCWGCRGCWAYREFWGCWQRVQMLGEAFGSQGTPVAPHARRTFCTDPAALGTARLDSPTHKPRFIPARGTSGVWDLHLCLEPGLVANLLK